MRSAAILFILLFVLGCGAETGPTRVPLYGNISLNGQPLSKGAISFYPTGGVSGPAAFAIVEQGAYKFTRDTGPCAGLHRVVIDLQHQSQNDVRSGGVKDIKNNNSAPGTTAKTQLEEEFLVPGDKNHRKDFDLKS